MLRLCQKRFVSPAVAVLAALGATSCAVPLGPAYTVEKQTLEVHFVPRPPRIEVRGDYILRNTGTQPLAAFELRLPPGRRVRLQSFAAAWDAQTTFFERQSDPAGDVLRLNLGASWPAKRRHTLHVAYAIVPGDSGQAQLAWPPDSFYLPAHAWLVVPQPPPGTFASGGAPPKVWFLVLRLPAEYAAQATGERARQDPRGAEQQVIFRQSTPGQSPFVVAGRYHELEYRRSPFTVHLWKKAGYDKAQAESFVSEVAQMAKVYDVLFGPRDKAARPLWIVDHPAPTSPPRGNGRPPEQSLHPEEEVSLQEPPPDFAFLPIAESGEPLSNEEATREVVAGFLVRTWLGYDGWSPGLEGQPYPLRALPDYAVCLAGESLRGGLPRTRRITEALSAYDQLQAAPGAPPKEARERSQAVERDSPEKNLLFFFALEDQFGRGNLHQALRHMIQARRGRGFELNDLIAALEQEARGNVAEFVRRWQKHPGIPGEFRARYASLPAPTRPEDTRGTTTFSKERTP